MYLSILILVLFRIKMLKLHFIIFTDKYQRNQSFGLNVSRFRYHQSNKLLQELTTDWKTIFDSLQRWGIFQTNFRSIVRLLSNGYRGYFLWQEAAGAWSCK
jgi:hypothetical protein